MRRNGKRGEERRERGLTFENDQQPFSSTRHVSLRGEEAKQILERQAAFILDVVLLEQILARGIRPQEPLLVERHPPVGTVVDVVVADPEEGVGGVAGAGWVGEGGVQGEHAEEGRYDAPS